MVAFLEKSTGSAGSTEASTDDNGEVKINATIDGHSLSITEGSLRRHLKLTDQDGITSIPNSEIFEQLALMGYHTDSDKLTFQKGTFSPQWRFLIHNILHCLSPKKTAWEQFSSNIAAAVICLATNRNFNFSRMIFEHMRHQLQQHTRTYPVPSLSMKVFNNIKRPTKAFSGQEVTLFPTMLAITTPSTSPSRITSSPSHSPKHSPSPTASTSPEPTPDHTTADVTQSSPTQPSPTLPSPGAEHHFTTPNESPLHVVHSHGSDEGSLKLNELTVLVTKLSDRIGALEDDLKKTKNTYSSAYTKLILRVKKLEARVKIGKARRQARVILSDDEDLEDDSSKQGRKLSDAEVQEKASTDTELFIQEVTPTEVIQDQEGSEKASDEVSTAGAKKGTASEEVPIVSTAEVNLSTAGGTVTYSRRSAEKRSRQDKGKAIMIESEPKKKSKKELEQERLSYAEAIRLEEQMNEEQRAQIARDEEIARQWDEEERQRAMAEAKSTKKIDWNDPSVIRPIFEKVWDFNQNIEPMDVEHGSEKKKSPEKSPEKMKSPEKEKAQGKRQKLEEDAEKEELKGFRTFIPREERLSCIIKYSEEMAVKNYKILSEMLEDFDRQDVEELYRLVKERYSTSRPEGFDLMLWGDLHTLFEPDEDDEIWKDQHEYNLLSWRLCDFCGIHILLMENRLAIHMLTEKKYPLSQEMLTKMLSRKLEVDHESSQAFELLRFIRSQVQK
ncbi:hypothetical protein Tco_0509575 [Tanacetum coccineum]